MKKLVHLALLASFPTLLFAQVENCNPEYSNTTGSNIDNPNAAVTQDIVISGTGLTVSNLTISIQWDHVWASDLYISLLHQGTQTTVDLVGEAGFGGDCGEPGYYNVTLTDKSFQGITAACGEVTGEYKPEGSLADFDGLAFDGTWTLSIIDVFPGLDAGNLNSWCINTDGAGGGDNVPPTAANDTLSVLVNTFISFLPLENDSDSDGSLDTTTLSVTTEATQGTSSVSNDSITYTPTESFVGMDSLEYEICDDGGECVKAWAFIDVVQSAPNLPPSIVDDAISAQTEVKVVANVLQNDSDPDGELLAFTLEINTAPNNGTATVENGKIAYTSNAAFVGNDTLEYVVCDDGSPSQCGNANLVITVVEELENTKPKSENDSFTVSSVETILNVLENDVDDESNIDASSVAIVTPPTLGTATVQTDGKIMYSTTAGTSGSDEFTYEVCDQGSPVLCDTATVTLDVDVTVSSIGNDFAQNIVVGPNPFNESITVNFGESQKATTIEILDLMGRQLIIKTLQGGQQITLNGNELPQGVYFLRAISIDGKSITKQIIKN